MIIDTSLKKNKKKKKKKNNRLVKCLIKKEPLKKPTKDNASKFNEWVNKNERGITSEIFQRYFSYQSPSDMLKDLYRINDKYKNNELVNVIKSGLSNLKNAIKYMSEEEKETEKPNEIIDTVEDILEFNKQNQQEQGLKILTPDQRLNRLPITLAQLKAGNNSQKLINEIRQLLSSLYRSKKLTKTIYNHLINAI